MNQSEAYQLITSQIIVTRQHIVIAKSHILKNFDASTSHMLKKLLIDLEAQKPLKVVLHPSVPIEPQIAQVAKAIIWELAFGEAIWSLIGLGILIPARSGLDTIDVNQEWTTIVPGGGGTTAGWNFEEHEISIPGNVRLAPSVVNQPPQPLSDPDLYLSDFEIAGLHAEVAESLRQAALCFRYELYLPCLAMLTKAAEGSWIEMGISLLKVDSENPSLNSEKRGKISEMLNSEYASMVQKMDTIVQLYDKQDIFKDVMKKSGANLRYLRGVLNWSNVVRGSRNAVHYGADPATQNTYEKVAALLLGAVPNLRILYAIRQAAEETVTPSGS